MAYIMLETSIRTHPKFLAAGPEACWLWLCGLGYCQDGLTDGRIPDSALDYLGVKNPKRLADRLVQVKLWDIVDGGWQMHDYLDHNRPAVEVREIMRKRREGGKKGGRPRKNLQGSEPENLQGFEVSETPDNLPRNPVLPVRPVRPERPTDQEAAAPPAAPVAPAREALHGVAFDGKCIRVARWMHDDMAKRIGTRPFDLLGWYERLDAEFERSGESFADTWKLLQHRLYIDANLPLPNLMGRHVHAPGARAVPDADTTSRMIAERRAERTR